MTDTEKKRLRDRAPKTIKGAIIISIPALVTGYMNHLKDEESRAVIVNESIRLEDKIDRLEGKIDRLQGFSDATSLMSLIAGGGLVSPAVKPIDPVRASSVVVTTATKARPKKRRPPLKKFSKRYRALF